MIFTINHIRYSIDLSSAESVDGFIAAAKNDLYYSLDNNIKIEGYNGNPLTSVEKKYKTINISLSTYKKIAFLIETPVKDPSCKKYITSFYFKRDVEDYQQKVTICTFDTEDFLDGIYAYNQFFKKDIKDLVFLFISDNGNDLSTTPSENPEPTLKIYYGLLLQ